MRALVEELYRRLGGEDVAELLTEGCTLRTTLAEARPAGRAEVAAYLAAWASAWREREERPFAVIADEDAAAAEVRLAAVPAAGGERVELEYLLVATGRDGRLDSLRVYGDTTRLGDAALP